MAEIDDLIWFIFKISIYKKEEEIILKILISHLQWWCALDVLSKDIYGVVADIGKFPWKSIGKFEKNHGSYHSSFMHTHDLNVPVPYPKSENVEWSETSEIIDWMSICNN